MSTFTDAVDRHFGFLRDELGLEPVYDESPGSDSVTYLGNPVSIEVSRDVRDHYTAVRLFASFGEPPDLLVTASVPLHVVATLRKGVFAPRDLTGMPGDDTAMDHLLWRQAQFLRTTGRASLEGDLTDFEAYADAMRGEGAGWDWWNRLPAKPEDAGTS